MKLPPVTLKFVPYALVIILMSPGAKNLSINARVFKIGWVR